jgi:anaerobic dimethyl sulfoxide reductase subunit B (iron-sulfur subunit)
MQIGFYFDQSRCSGCNTCIIACKDWHDNSDSEPRNWIRIKKMETGKFPAVSLSYLFQTCFHCLKPACIKACPEGAIKKIKDNGIVVVDRDICLGGNGCDRLCLSACPYDVPAFGEEPGAKMEKCDLCLDRWPEKKPICVEACPMRALDAGPIEELTAKYGSNHRAEGFFYSANMSPSIIFTKSG